MSLAQPRDGLIAGRLRQAKERQQELERGVSLLLKRLLLALEPKSVGKLRLLLRELAQTILSLNVLTAQSRQTLEAKLTRT